MTTKHEYPASLIAAADRASSARDRLKREGMQPYAGAASKIAYDLAAIESQLAESAYKEVLTQYLHGVK